MNLLLNNTKRSSFWRLFNGNLLTAVFRNNYEPSSSADNVHLFFARQNWHSPNRQADHLCRNRDGKNTIRTRVAFAIRLDTVYLSQTSGAPSFPLAASSSEPAYLKIQPPPKGYRKYLPYLGSGHNMYMNQNHPK